MSYPYGVVTTGAAGLSDLLGKDIASDARSVAEHLATERVIPAALRGRIKGIQLELSKALAEAVLAGPERSRLAGLLAEPVQQLTASIKRSADLDSEADRDQIRLAMLAVAQAMEIYETSAEPWAQTPAVELVRLLGEMIGWSQADLASALHVDVRTVQRWLHDGSPGPEEEARIRALFRIARPLRYVMTPRGVDQWLRRPLIAVDNRPPVNCLDDDRAVVELERLVFALRG